MFNAEEHLFDARIYPRDYCGVRTALAEVNKAIKTALDPSSYPLLPHSKGVNFPGIFRAFFIPLMNSEIYSLNGNCRQDYRVRENEGREREMKAK